MAVPQRRFCLDQDREVSLVACLAPDGNILLMYTLLMYLVDYLLFLLCRNPKACNTTCMRDANNTTKREYQIGLESDSGALDRVADHT